MSIKWLSAHSFKQSQDLLSAINTLSMNAKLELAGAPDEKVGEAAVRAREVLGDFFGALETVVDEAEQEGAKPVIGAGLRLRQLARRFVNARNKQRRFHSALSQPTFARARQLLGSEREEDRQALIDSLDELRVLLEEQAHLDAEHVLGDI